MLRLGIRIGAAIRLLRTISLLTLIACSAPETSVQSSLEEGPGPSLILHDSIILEENDSVFLARPEQGLTVDDEGLIYIPDELGSRVIRYTPSGRIDHVFGRPGDGPGELRSTQRVTLVFDTIVMQSTAGKLMAFHRRTGRFLFEKLHDRSYLLPPALDGDSIFLPLFSLSEKKALLVTSRATLERTDSASLHSSLLPNHIAFPPEYLANPGLQSFSLATAAVWKDSLLVGFAGVPYVVLYSRAGEARDTIQIPWRVRHGHPKGWIDAFARGRRPTLEEMVGAASFLHQLWRLPDGSFLLWHQDNRVATSASSKATPRLKGNAYLSVLSADRTRVCADTPLSFPGTDWPRLGLKGDTLLAVDQIAQDHHLDSVKTIIRRYVITTTHCRWLKTS